MNSPDFLKFESVPNGALKNATPKLNDIDADITGNTQNAGENINNAFDQSTQGHPSDFGKYSKEGYQQNFTMPGNGQQLNAGNLVNPEMAVQLLDVLMPTVFVLLMKNVMNKTVNKNAYTLTAAEKKTFEPVIQSCLNSINFNVNNPWNALLLVAGMIYGMKTIDVLNSVPAGRSSAPIEPVVAASTGALKKDGRGRPAGSLNKKGK